MKALDGMVSDDERTTSANKTKDAVTAQELWEVWRRDDNANEFRISRHLTQSAAQARVDHFESLGHKQDYWVQPRHT